MRRVVVTIAAALIILGTAGAAQAQVIQMAANLVGANETPAPVLTGAFATASVTVDMTAKSVSWIIDVWNLPSGMTNAHFHVGGAGLGGPTVVNIPFPPNISNDFRLTGSATTFSTLQPNQGIRSWDDFLQSLVGGQTYLNIHTANFGGGEIRGQVFRVQQMGPGGPGGPGGPPQ